MLKSIFSPFLYLRKQVSGKCMDWRIPTGACFCRFVCDLHAMLQWKRCGMLLLISSGNWLDMNIVMHGSLIAVDRSCFVFDG